MPIFPINVIRIASTALLAVLLACGVHAQGSAALEGVLPDSIVVTASRYPEGARYTGRRVAVWTARDIERLPVTSADDLLRTVAGVDVQSRGGFGIQSDLSIRGSGFNGVLLLLDGAPINDPMTGHFLADVPVPLSEIARVEVLRGPAAAIYGPDAMGGVVQLFTYAGLRSSPFRTPLQPAGSIRGGQHALYDVEVSASKGGDALYVDAASAWQGTDGERIGGGDVRTDFTRRVHTGAASARLANATVFGRVGWDEREFGAYHFYTPFPSDTARESTSTLWGQVRMESDAWTGSVHAKQHFDRYVYNPITPANEHTSRMVTVYLARRWTPASSLTISSGFEGGMRGIDSNNLGRHQDASGGVFVSTGFRSGSVGVQASGHGGYDPAYGFEFTPQIYGALHGDVVVLRAGAARAVRAPNYIERYFNTTLARPRGRSLGNPDLDPERAWAAEAGVSVETTSGLRLHATTFGRITRDLIDYAMTSPQDTVFLAQNLHRVRMLGFEAEVEAHRRLGRAEADVTAAYTYLDADLGDVASDISFKYALTHARHLLQTTLAIRRSPLTVGVRTLYKEPIDGDGYIVAHAQGAYTRRYGTGRLTFSVELRNVFDTAYADVFDAPMPGRWWVAGVAWRP